MRRHGAVSSGRDNLLGDTAADISRSVDSRNRRAENYFHVGMAQHTVLKYLGSGQVIQILKKRQMGHVAQEKLRLLER
jgi:hypothetical protein